MVLDRYKKIRLDTLRMEYDHCAARYVDVALAATLCVAFDNFEQMNLNRICANSDTTYQEAEELAEAFSEVFDLDVPVENFMPNTDKRSDMVIHYYNLYKEDRESIVGFGYAKEDLDAFCKMAFYQPHKNGLGQFVAFNSVDYKRNITSVYRYLYGGIDFFMLQRGMTSYTPPSDLKPMTRKQVMAFVRTMKKVLDTFRGISKKRTKRVLKD